MREYVEHDDHGGLGRDLIQTATVMSRRRALRLAAGLGVTLGGLGAIPILGCASATDVDASGDAPIGQGACSKIPQETEGPYPGDGSNGPNVLSQSGVVRSDIRPSFAGLSGTADGVPLTLVMNLVSASTCSPLAGAAVYVWHCDRPGRYSLYTAGATSQNYLRGVQAADANGKVTFQTIYPGCYAGRWPHIHFEVYQSLAAATAVSNKKATSQIALPKATNDLVYATGGYEQSKTNQAQVTLASDMVFADGATLELPTISGAVASGLTATLTVAVAL